MSGNVFWDKLLADPSNPQGHLHETHAKRKKETGRHRKRLEERTAVGGIVVVAAGDSWLRFDQRNHESPYNGKNGTEANDNHPGGG